MHISEMNTVVCTVPAEDVARVKGLGCLRDKTTPDCFNCRVLTRNGKITSAESIAIAEAAAKFGKGEVAMTTRQTIEIQGVPYENIDAMRAFLNQHGLDIGGTGPKVRPVVLRLRPDRYLQPVPEDPRAVLHRLPRCEAAP